MVKFSLYHDLPGIIPLLKAQSGEVKEHNAVDPFVKCDVKFPTVFI